MKERWQYDKEKQLLVYHDYRDNLHFYCRSVITDYSLVELKGVAWLMVHQVGEKLL